jgi:hypothetical protein
VKGDRVEIVVDAGGMYGTARTYEIAATRAGRRVDVRTGRGLVEVTEVTRGGTPVRTARFMASRVLALVEHPANETLALEDDEQPDSGRTAAPLPPRPVGDADPLPEQLRLAADSALPDEHATNSHLTRS